MKSQLIPAAVLALLLFVPSTAFAKKGIPFIYNTGQEAFETGPLPEPYDKNPQLQGFTAGYLCDIKGVLWSFFSVSNCKPVAFKDDSYFDDAELATAIQAKYPESSMKRGVWDRFGWMMMGGLALVGGLIALKGFFSKGDDADDDSEDSETKKAA